MRHDLCIGFLAVAVPAFLGALGGISLLCREQVRAQDDLREDVRARADALAQSLFKRYSAVAGNGLPEKVDALAADLDGNAFLATAFVWRKGKGVIWTKGEDQMILREIDGSFKWVAEGNRVRYPKRGFFTATGATVAWFRIGSKDVGGYVLDPCGDGARANPKARFAFRACILAAIVGLVVSGAFYLRRAAARAREESDALVEMLRHNMESQEVEHVHV